MNAETQKTLAVEALAEWKRRNSPRFKPPPPPVAPRAAANLSDAVANLEKENFILRERAVRAEQRLRAIAMFAST